MNNKGFGLPELLVFIGCSIFVLIGFMTYWNKPKTIKQENISNIADPIIKPSNIEISSEYIKLEDKLKNASKKYGFNKKENTIISLKKLKNKGLINEIKDPFDKNITCNGYVIYNSEEKTYTPYINCPGMYTTKNFNDEFN